jgi:large subunit ribosomal protein L5
MADENEKKEKKPKAPKAEDGAPKAEKPAKAEKAEAKGEGGEKAPKAEKAEKKGGGDKKGGGGGGGKGKGKQLEEKPRVPARLGLRYNAEIRTALMKTLGLKNVYEVPTIKKVVINMGLGEAITNNKVLDLAVDEIQAITGQKAVITKSKKSISNFKLRENMPIGAMVTLRRGRMWEFLDRLIAIALPRTRDFKGISEKAFDGRGNYTLGLKEQIIFPEIDYDKVDKIRGMNICIVTSAKDDVQGRALLEAIGMPLMRRQQPQEQQQVQHG